MSIPGILPPAAWGDASGSSGGGGGGGGSTTLISTLQSLGLTTGLQLCLDAGDATSYGGTGQQWSDTSGNANHFYRGSSSSSESSDPTFNGAAGTGGSSNYWSFDGGDYFSLVAGSNPTWVNSLHKASAKFAFAGWLYHGATPEYLFTTATTTNDAGISFNVSATSANKLKFTVDNKAGGSSVAFEIISSASFTISAWQFFGMRIDVAGNSVTLQIHSTQETSSASYTSPSTSNATNVAKLATRPDLGQPFPSASRLASIAAWQGTIPSAADLTAIYNSTKAGFGL